MIKSPFCKYHRPNSLETTGLIINNVFYSKSLLYFNVKLDSVKKPIIIAGVKSTIRPCEMKVASNRCNINFVLGLGAKVVN